MQLTCLSLIVPASRNDFLSPSGVLSPPERSDLPSSGPLVIASRLQLLNNDCKSLIFAALLSKDQLSLSCVSRDMRNFAVTKVAVDVSVLLSRLSRLALETFQKAIPASIQVTLIDLLEFQQKYGLRERSLHVYLEEARLHPRDTLRYLSLGIIPVDLACQKLIKLRDNFLRYSSYNQEVDHLFTIANLLLKFGAPLNEIQGTLCQCLKYSRMDSAQEEKLISLLAQQDSDWLKEIIPKISSKNQSRLALRLHLIKVETLQQQDRLTRKEGKDLWYDFINSQGMQAHERSGENKIKSLLTSIKTLTLKRNPEQFRWALEAIEELIENHSESALQSRNLPRDNPGVLPPSVMKNRSKLQQQRRNSDKSLLVQGFLDLASEQIKSSHQAFLVLEKAHTHVREMSNAELKERQALGLQLIQLYIRLANQFMQLEACEKSANCLTLAWHVESGLETDPTILAHLIKGYAQFLAKIPRRLCLPDSTLVELKSLLRKHFEKVDPSKTEDVTILHLAPYIVRREKDFLQSIPDEKMTVTARLILLEEKLKQGGGISEDEFNEIVGKIAIKGDGSSEEYFKWYTQLYKLELFIASFTGQLIGFAKQRIFDKLFERLDANDDMTNHLTITSSHLTLALDELTKLFKQMVVEIRVSKKQSVVEQFAQDMVLSLLGRLEKAAQDERIAHKERTRLKKRLLVFKKTVGDAYLEQGKNYARAMLPEQSQQAFNRALENGIEACKIDPVKSLFTQNSSDLVNNFTSSSEKREFLTELMTELTLTMTNRKELSTRIDKLKESLLSLEIVDKDHLLSIFAEQQIKLNPARALATASEMAGFYLLKDTAIKLLGTLVKHSLPAIPKASQTEEGFTSSEGL